MKQLHTAVPITISTILCLTFYCLSGASTAFAAQASFSLTEQSLNELRKDGLPNDIIKKLTAIQDKRFDTEDELLDAIRREIGRDRAIRYKEQILNRSTDDISSEIKQITKALDEQKRTIDALLAQNRALEDRLAELEMAREERAKKQTEAEINKQEELEQRVKELEDMETVREDATRAIIRDSVSTLGSKINEAVALGGTFEVLAGWAREIPGDSGGFVTLNTAELDFEVMFNDWTTGSLIIEWDDGTDVIFPTTSGFQTGIDRINLDTAFITVGDPLRFPPFLTFGRIILPFGISTGDPVTDVLTNVDPLTLSTFELRNTAFGFGLGFPTPAPKPPTPPVTPPKVRPLVINPLFTSLFKSLGYESPIKRPPALTPISPPPTPPLFNVGIYSYDGSTFENTDTGGYKPGEHWGATVGFRTQGSCGRPFDKLGGSLFCPWAIDVDVDYNSSIFDSRFLEFEYRDFLGQIGFVPAMAASIKGTIGPVSLIGEWNGAISRAMFIDDIGQRVSIAPTAWQVTLGYQFDWNPWVESIGAQGNYLAFGYSESRDLAGVAQLIDGELTRVGFAPKRRFIISAGEWVLENLRFAIEYSYAVDYPVSEGGTGRSASTIFSAFTAVW